MIDVRTVKPGALCRVNNKIDLLDVDKFILRRFQTDDVVMFLGYKTIQPQKMPAINVLVQVLFKDQTLWFPVGRYYPGELPEDMVDTQYIVPWLLEAGS